MSQNICGDFLVEISFKVFLGSPDPGTALETSDFFVLHYFNYPNLKKYICKHMYMYIKTEPLTFFYFFVLFKLFSGSRCGDLCFVILLSEFSKDKKQSQVPNPLPLNPPLLETPWNRIFSLSLDFPSASSIFSKFSKVRRVLSKNFLKDLSWN